jgi:hypothetical protein
LEEDIKCFSEEYLGSYADYAETKHKLDTDMSLDVSKREELEEIVKKKLEYSQ